MKWQFGNWKKLFMKYSNSKECFSNIYNEHLLFVTIFDTIVFSISENDHFSGDDFPILVISRFNQSSANWNSFDRAAF